MFILFDSHLSIQA